MGRNADLVHAIQQRVNGRDWEAIPTDIADECVFIDGEGEVLRGQGGYLTYVEGWISAFSDCKITDNRIHEAGDVVVTEFVLRGRHDGSLGSIPATGRSISLPCCENYHLSGDGAITGGRAYVDLLTLMRQLGLADPRRTSDRRGTVGADSAGWRSGPVWRIGGMRSGTASGRGGGPG